MRARLAVFVGLSIMGSAALAAQHQVPTKVLLVKNPPSGARKVLWKVKETGSAAIVAGNPTTDGATLRIRLTTGGDQCVSMPSSGWSAVGSLGFKYKDAALANGPVKVALIKKSASGTLLIKALLKNGGATSISVAPDDPTTSYATNLTLGTGDDYCGGTASATPNPNDATTFKVVNDGAPAGCIAPCSVAPVSCNPTTPNGTPCDDGLACTDDEFCLNGVCGNGASNCAGTPGNLCVETFCDGESGVCVAQPLVCPDPDQPQCWLRVCHPESGLCSSNFIGDGNLSCTASECQMHADCDDGNLCTLDQCLGAVGQETCSWSPINCNDGLECTVDSCLKDTGCEHRVENPITFCDDQIACTDDDSAVDYAASCGCTHTPRNSACDDGDPCTADACNPATGCAHPSICDDGLACTTDLCDPGTQQCSHVELNCSGS